MNETAFYYQKIQPNTRETSFKVSLGVLNASLEALLNEKNNYLQHNELAYFFNLKHQKRQLSYLLGRYVGKQTIKHHYSRQNLDAIYISRGLFHFPVIHGLAEKMQISLSHCQQYSTALFFPEELPMGIDLELVDGGQTNLIKTQLTKHENTLLGNQSEIDITTRTFLMWTAKESLAKTLKTGLTTPLQVYEIQSIECYASTFICLFSNFSQYKALSFLIGNIMISITLPKKLRCDINVKHLKKWFNHL